MKNLITSIFLFSSIVTFSQNLEVKSDDVRIEFLTVAKNCAGTIGGFNANIQFDAENLTNSKIEGTVDLSTLNTGSEKRDEHLRSDDFFSAENYPTMHFESTQITVEENKYRMTGILTIEDKSHEVIIDFTYHKKVFRGEMTFSMSHYDIGGYSKKEGDESNVTVKFTVPVN